MCFELAKLLDEKWLASITEVEEERAEWEASAPAQAEPSLPGTFKYQFPDYPERAEEASAPAQAEPALPPTFKSQARADLFVLTVETELYAAVMYDKRKLIHHHALSQV